MNDAKQLTAGKSVTEVLVLITNAWTYIHPLFQILMHELGHNLGLEHSNVKGSVMSAFLPWRPHEFVLKLQPDDVKRIQALYGAGTGSGAVQTLPPGQPAEGQVKTMLYFPVQSQISYFRLRYHHRPHGQLIPQEACQIRQHIRLGLITPEGPDIDGPIIPKGQHIVRITLEDLIIPERLLKLIFCQTFQISFLEV